MINSLLRKPLVLPEDVQIVPMIEIPEDIRKRLHGENGDFALSRARSRQTSKLITRETAALLDYFRSPRTLVKGVAHYSLDRCVDPERTLEEALPTFRNLIASGLLVPEHADGVERVRPFLATGSGFAEYCIVQCVQVLDDSEVYQARRDDGTFAALKLARKGREAFVAPRLKREVAVLQRLDGRVNPRFLASGDARDRPYIALCWRGGVDAAAAASEVRSCGNRQGLLRLLANIVKAYALLHRQGVIHGDVHPGNLLIDRNCRTTIIDYGLSDFVNGDLPPSPRGGIGFFHDPEQAAAMLGDSPLPPAGKQSEQYSVAVLLYLLATGHHYVEFSLESQVMLNQILEEAPMPFRDCGIAPWPDLESVLARALSKSAAGRYRDMDAFADALSEIVVPGDAIPTILNPTVSKFVEKMLNDLRPGQDLFQKGLPVSPYCSVNFGMAGIAYALYRIACARGDAALLSCADLWIAKAMRAQEEDHAFCNPALDVTAETIGRVSPYHCASGVEAVHSLIAHCMGNFVEMETAQNAFLSAVDHPCSERDLTLGVAGIVLACAILIEASPRVAWPTGDALQAIGSQRLGQIWSQVNDFDPMDECKDWPNLGIAHGWAGLLYTTLRWHATTGERIPRSLPDRLAELSRCARPLGRGLSWPWRNAGKRETSMPGWCNGAAGFVHLGCLSHRLLGGDDNFSLAEGAAWQTWESGAGLIDLCCGLAGRAYALLEFYRLSGEPVWLQRAERLAHRAVRLSADARDPEHPRQSLYKGELGLVILLTEIDRPEVACMPMFGEER